MALIHASVSLFCVHSKYFPTVTFVEFLAPLDLQPTSHYRTTLQPDVTARSQPITLSSLSTFLRREKQYSSSLGKNFLSVDRSESVQSPTCALRAARDARPPEGQHQISSYIETDYGDLETSQHHGIGMINSEPPDSCRWHTGARDCFKLYPWVLHGTIELRAARQSARVPSDFQPRLGRVSHPMQNKGRVSETVVSDIFFCHSNSS
ncbi:hypothetical protein BJV78DRAFT_1355451 [Lactifluus subvellereus]|nr:hypothetical protein BJV78DRAFT_1355451 [Lactifluus subvellereus]